jgi:hypothetical protein
LAGRFFSGVEGRFRVRNYIDTIAYSPKRKECHTEGKDYLPPSQACKYFGDNITWASFGDSHTVEIAYALAERLKENNEGLVHLSFSGCPPALLFEAKNPGCSEWLVESLNYLENEKSIKNVLVGFRYSAYLYGSQLDAYPRLPNLDPKEMFSDNFRASTNGDAKNIFWNSFNTIVSRLLVNGKNVYILYPIPELPVDINKAILPFSIFGDTPVLDLSKATDVAYYQKRNAFILDKLNKLPYGDKLHAIKPVDIICDRHFCPAVMANKALYFDDNHLSVSGAELVIKDLNLASVGSMPLS